MTRELRLYQGYDLLIGDLLDVGRVVGCFGFLIGGLPWGRSLRTEQRTWIDPGVEDSVHPVKSAVPLDFANGHERPEGVTQVLLEGIARHEGLQPCHGAGMPIRVVSAIYVLTCNLPNGDAVRYLPRHHHEIADLDSVRKLIELRGEVLERVLCRAWHDLLQMRQDCIAALQGSEVTDFEKAWQKPLLFYCSKLAIAMLASANNPEAGHSVISRNLGVVHLWR